MADLEVGSTTNRTRLTNDPLVRPNADPNAQPDKQPVARTDQPAERDTFTREADKTPRAPDANLTNPANPANPAAPLAAAVPANTGGAPLSPADAISRSNGTFELASRALEAGRGPQAAEILRGGSAELRRSIPAGNPTEQRALTVLADNMDARAAAYGETAPGKLRERAGTLVDKSWEARRAGEELQRTNPDLARRLTEVGTESRLQAEVLFHAAANTDSLLGRGVGQTYRAIANASFDQAINNTGSINNFFTGARDELTRDRGKMNAVFDALDRKMEREGISFDRAWSGMFDDHRINSPDIPAGFPTAGDAARWMRDHQTTRGLLSPMADISRNLSEGNDAGVDRARGDLVQSLRTNGQWDLARNVLDDLQNNSRSPEGTQRAQSLNDSERREWWSQKAGEFVQKDLPVLLLSTAVSGGAGLGARALAGAAGWGSRAMRGAQIATEIGAFVPTERVLNDVINGRRADWSAGGLARDYAIAAGGYGLFSALGSGYRALRAPRAVAAEGGEALALGGRPTRINPADAKENIRALTRENESAGTLAQRGYRVEQNPQIPGGNVPGVKHPDYRIGGEYFDNFAPTTGSARNIWTTVEGKVSSQQARRIVLNLDDSKVSIDALRAQFRDWPINGLEQVLVVQRGQVFPLALGRGTPMVRPMGYPNQDN